MSYDRLHSSLDGGRERSARNATLRRAGDFEHITGSVHCLITSYRRDGTPISQPVWPGYADGRIYLWTEAEAYKAKRIRRNPSVLVAPCTFRGRPLGPPAAGLARVLDDPEQARRARDVIRAQWGWKRRTFERISRPLTDVVYIEIRPAGAGGPSSEPHA